MIEKMNKRQEKLLYASWMLNSLAIRCMSASNGLNHLAVSVNISDNEFVRRLQSIREDIFNCVGASGCPSPYAHAERKIEEILDEIVVS